MFSLPRMSLQVPVRAASVEGVHAEAQIPPDLLLRSIYQLDPLILLLQGNVSHATSINPTFDRTVTILQQLFWYPDGGLPSKRASGFDFVLNLQGKRTTPTQTLQSLLPMSSRALPPADCYPYPQRARPRHTLSIGQSCFLSRNAITSR